MCKEGWCVRLGQKGDVRGRKKWGRTEKSVGETKILNRRGKLGQRELQS